MYGPQLLPGGQHVLFTLATGTAPDRWDKAQSSSRRSRREIQHPHRGGRRPHVPTGHIGYAFEGNCSLLRSTWADWRSRETPSLFDDVSRPGETTGAFHFSFSSTGSLVYVPGPSSLVRHNLALIDRREGSNRCSSNLVVTDSPHVSRRHAHRLWDR